MRFTSCLSVILVLVVGFAGHAVAEGADGFDIEAIDAIVVASRRGDDPELSATAPFPTDKRNRPMIMVSRAGTPVLSYVPAAIGEYWYTNTAFSCGPEGTLDIVATVAARDRPNPFDSGQQVTMRLGDREGSAYRVAVELVDVINAEAGILRVHGRVPADDPFFLERFGTLTYPEARLTLENSWTLFQRPLFLGDFDEVLRPLVRTCAGLGPVPPAVAEPEPREHQGSDGIARLIGPSGEDIKAALERELAARMQKADEIAADCDTAVATGDMNATLRCLGGGMGAVSSRNTKFTVDEVFVERCVLTDAGRAICQYKVDASVSGSGSMSVLASILDANAAGGAWTYGAFQRTDDGWRFERSYRSCDFDTRDENGMFTCEYRR